MLSGSSVVRTFRHLAPQRSTAVVFLVYLCAGCGSSHEASLTGVVTYKGQPVQHTLMNFHNDGGGPMAYAMTDESGHFEAKTGSASGLMPGKYRLAFQSQSPGGLPPKYERIDQSGLEYDIKEGENAVEIELE